MALPGLKPLAEIAETKPHGHPLKYKAGCRCFQCTAAMCRYHTEREEAKRRGEWNGFVSAAKARRHIQKLSRKHVGHRTIAEVAGVPRSTVQRIANGKKLNIRKATETRILSVTADARADASRIPAAPTWKLINRLLREGFTKAELARRLGCKAPALQIRKDLVQARTALKVERLFKRIMAE